MGKQNKQDQSAQKEMNDYEKIRLLRIQENQARLKDLGVKSIANSLTSLVESQKPKKKQVKPTSTSARDSDYIPDVGDDNDGDYQEVARSVEVSKKQHRPQYIAPMSMNRLANLTSQRRVIAPNVLNKYPLASNATKEKQSRSKTSMGDLILRNKGPQRGRDVFKQNAEKHNCIRSGPKRELALVDEDEDDEISQADMEQFGLKDDVNKGRIVQCEEDDVDQNDDYEDMDHMTYANIENEIEVDDSDEDLGNEDDGKYDVPDDAKTWVLRTIGNLYKVYKCRFKKKHFYQFKDNKTRWKNRPECIPQEEFSKLLVLWNKKDVAKRCLWAKEIRKSLKNMHTAGPKSFARIRDEMKNEDPNKEFPTLSQMFERTRKRTDGRVYVDTYDDMANKIEQMKKYEHVEGESDVVDPYMIVMKKENDGYRRLYGRGVTNRLIKKVGGGDASYMIPAGLMESFKANEVERNELIEMRKEIQEDHEKKQAELEAMRIEIKNQQQNLEAMMRKLAEQQRREGR
ncbi:unnamed protein product [Lactuca virosa]|uniref:Transposase, Ptta/En/Spm n=1 Tax=Lactuca virosa TaxID=75947 RepID=A0AAU9M690_9ASTR|nr:unnamed protein product [Lactuca virosa]